LFGSFENKSIIKDVMTIALKEIPNQILDLEKAIHDKDRKKMHIEAHKIKGTASYLRFIIIEKTVEKLEFELNDDLSKNIDHYIAEIKSEWEIIKKIIHQIIN
jgi:HPt (histidine-containing phosphotransfer) domain-containing protein